MNKEARTDYPIHELLRRRWSVRAFSPRLIEPEVIGSLLEAARWAPSSINEQPWRFIVAARQDVEVWQRLFACLRPSNQEWAGPAPLLMLVVARVVFEDGGQTNRHAFHDVGSAVAQLTLQATAMDLYVHQMAGYDMEQARQSFAVPEGFEPVSVLAIGYYGDPDGLPERRRAQEAAERTRKPLSEIAFGGRFGIPLVMTS